MFRLIRKYGFLLGFRIWNLRRKSIARRCTAMTAFNLRNKAKMLDRKRNPVAAELIRSIADEIHPVAKNTQKTKQSL